MNPVLHFLGFQRGKQSAAQMKYSKAFNMPSITSICASWSIKVFVLSNTYFKVQRLQLETTLNDNYLSILNSSNCTNLPSIILICAWKWKRTSVLLLSNIHLYVQEHSLPDWQFQIIISFVSVNSLFIGTHTNIWI